MGGSETFSYTLAKEMVRRGHEVDVFALDQGLLSLRFSANGLNIVKHPRPSYDILFISHNTVLRRCAMTEGFKIVTCHGVVPELEQPEVGADLYVAVSPEVREHLMSKGFQASVIYNGVNCKRFKPPERKREKLKRVFCLPQSSAAQETVKMACGKMGLQFDWSRQEWEVERRMQDADLVVSLGRGAIEGLACGAAVVAYDNRPYMGGRCDGMITPENFHDLRKFNISGRYHNKLSGHLELCEEFEKWDASMPKANRALALEHCDIEKKIEEYLNLYKLHGSRLPAGSDRP